LINLLPAVMYCMINMLAEHCMLKKGASREMPHGSS
jgi:hypothetical protein